MMGSDTKEFEGIYYGSGNINLTSTGKLKLAPLGLGWKESTTGTIHTLPAAEIKRTQWLRSCRNYQLRITKPDHSLVKFEGFLKEVPINPTH